MNGKVLTFGELLLRLTPDANGEWMYHNSLPVFVGGAELNVATALALWGLPASYCTALPDNGMSEQVITYLKERNIDTTPAHLGEGRIGLYFLTKGKDLKNDALIYDRADSAFAKLKPGTINWDELLEGVSWFHFSAISPAVSQNAANVCLEALKAASAKGITISVDLNYRAKLWQYGRSPQEIMTQLLPYCNVVMGNIWAAETMLGIQVMPDVHESGQKSIYLKEAQKSSEAIMARYPSCKQVANTFRFGSEGEITYYTALHTGNKFLTSHEYWVNDVISKVGSGDCFMAGLIYGFYNEWHPAEVLEYATASAITKLYVVSDATDKSVNEIKKAISYE
ncbi:sugar kinase [Mucilaginibacter limnophilus]|uniref:Sugar kinase n=1 Tax=Mucilaginibacter limnophilus TaxID=1932778 RepID=A0A437MRJ1_9SPHI|nr:sugar kinase [Mucilaginibacter limnophilus]RVU00270.1 sugar kinase [Mucilaginibacter limnophilus]